MKVIALILGLGSVLAAVAAMFHFVGFWGALLFFGILFFGLAER